MFVTADSFNLAPYNLPNLNEVGDTFLDFVDEQEKEALIKIIGRLLYTKLEEGLFVDGVEIPDPAQRWKDLRDGVDYTHGGRTYHWDGLTKIFKPYIYCVWTRETADSHSGLGIVAADHENSKAVSPAPRMSRAYNDFARRVGVKYSFEDTLYGYLYNSGETYAADISPQYDSIQTYLIERFHCPKLTTPYGL